MKPIAAFFKDETGLTTVEYAVAGALIAGVLVTAFTELGTKVKDVIQGIKGVLKVPAP